MNHKTIATIAFFSIAIFIGTSINCKKHETDRYYNKAKKFSIKIPEGWNIEEKKLHTDMIAVSPPESFEDNFRENFNVLVEELPSSMDTNEYYQKGLPLFQQLAKEFTHHSSGFEKIDSVNFRYDIISHKMGPLKIKVLQYLTVHRNKGYLITFSALNEKYAQYEPLFKEIAKTFRFE